METTSRAKVFFLELGILAALYISVASFLTFIFQIINYAFPDRQAYAADPYSTGMRFAISTLIVVFPVLIYLSHLAYKMLTAHAELRTAAIRKWLSYLTLFLAGAMIVIDLITLVNTFLSGEIGARFSLKVFAVLLVAGLVFWYTIRDLKGIYFKRPTLVRVFTIVVSVIVLVSIIAGFIIIGSPAKQRMLRDDMDRVNDLTSIQWNILNHYQTTGDMPGTLNDLKDQLYDQSYFDDTYTDPKTGEAYEYRPLTSTTTLSLPFELCATFELESQDLAGRGDYVSGGTVMPDAVSRPYYGGDFDSNFKHIAGRNCFTRSIDTKKYPVYEK